MYTGLDVLSGRRSFSVTTVGGRVCPTQPFSLPASCSPPPPPTVDSTASRVAVVDVVVVPSPFESADSSPASRSRSRTALGGGTTGKNCCSACRCPGPRLRMTARPAPAIDIDRPSDSVAIDDRPIHRRADFAPHWCCPWRVMERRSTTGPSSCRLRPSLVLPLVSHGAAIDDRPIVVSIFWNIAVRKPSSTTNICDCSALRHDRHRFIG